jgi:hypothetical protein
MQSRLLQQLLLLPARVLSLVAAFFVTACRLL